MHNPEWNLKSALHMVSKPGIPKKVSTEGMNMVPFGMGIAGQ